MMHSAQDVDKALKETQARHAHWEQKLALLREEYERDIKEMGDLQIAVQDDEEMEAAAEGGAGDEAMAEGKEAAAEAAKRKVGVAGVAACGLVLLASCVCAVTARGRGPDATVLLAGVRAVCRGAGAPHCQERQI